MVNIGIDRLRHLRQKPILARDNRASFKHEQWNGVKGKFILQVTAGGIVFMLWFLACCSYLFGTLFNSTNRHHNFKVLAVDYDGAVVGQALAGAYQQLKGPAFFTVEVHTPAEFPTEDDMYHAVYTGKYWGSIAATAGAWERLSAALQGGQTAATYNASDALHYVWNQQRYTSFSQSVVQAGMTQLVAATGLVYNHLNGTQATQIVNRTDPAAVQALLHPIASTARNIMPAPFGAIIFLNTVSMAMPVLQQFFFLLVLNGVLAQHNLYTRMTVRSSLLIRRFAGLAYSFGAALCQTGYFWAFREGWDVNGNQFVLTWMLYWLLMHIHLLILDSISTLAPLPIMPLVVILWVFLNIASTLSPLEIQAGFYHWGICLPSHNAYSIDITIWTGGADNLLYRALPILFSWWILANITTSLTHWRACHLAYKHDKKIEEKDATTLPTGKDEEAGLGSSGDEMLSRQQTLQRERVFEDAVTERRQAYGPSIPPLV